jgi:hypothetical protein
MKRTILVAVAALTIAAPSFAATRFHKREVEQQKRIAQGVASGALTPRETAKIEGQEAALIREKNRFAHSGDGLSWREKAKLNEQQNRLSREIDREKHD